MAAEDSSYVAEGGKQHPFFFVQHVDRKTNLEGRINIYVAPESKNTVVTVNTKYIFVVTASGRVAHHHLYGNIVGWSNLTPETFTHSFNTNELYQDTIRGDGADDFLCFGTGRLEKEILAIVDQG